MNDYRDKELDLTHLGILQNHDGYEYTIIYDLEKSDKRFFLKKRRRGDQKHFLEPNEINKYCDSIILDNVVWIINNFNLTTTKFAVIDSTLKTLEIIIPDHSLLFIKNDLLKNSNTDLKIHDDRGEIISSQKFKDERFTIYLLDSDFQV